jgi:AcrR family transcriptional regulator
MKTASKMSSADRRIGIINAAQKIFVEKGFYRTTTRELAEAAGVSEALLFKHFPSKEALYSAIQKSCFKEEGSKVHQRLESLKPSTSTLVFLVQDIISHILGGQPEEGGRSFLRLVLRSLMDEGEFARLGIQGGPSHWVQKVKECIEAAKAAGDMVVEPTTASLGGWCTHQVIAGFMMHFLPVDPVIDYGVSRDELVDQVIWFCLRGMGLKEKAIRRYYKSQGAPKSERSRAC